MEEEEEEREREEEERQRVEEERKRADEKIRELTDYEADILQHEIDQVCLQTQIFLVTMIRGCGTLEAYHNDSFIL